MIPCDLKKPKHYFTARKHLFHPSCPALLLLSGVEEKTKQTCPAEGRVSMMYLSAQGISLPDVVGPSLGSARAVHRPVLCDV